MNHEDDLARHLRELFTLIRKILTTDKSGDLQKLFDAKNKHVQVNLCFFTFLPVSAEDLEELGVELQEALDQAEDVNPELAFELNPGDEEFLRRNGIRF